MSSATWRTGICYDALGSLQLTNQTGNNLCISTKRFCIRLRGLCRNASDERGDIAKVLRRDKRNKISNARYKETDISGNVVRKTVVLFVTIFRVLGTKTIEARYANSAIHTSHKRESRRNTSVNT